MITVSRITITSLISTLSAACQITAGPRWDILACWDCTIAREIDSYTHLRLDDAALAALKTLADTCDAAPWGQQTGEHGRVFVRNWGGWPHDDSRSVQVCVDGLPVVTVRYGWDMETQARTVIAVIVHDRAAERTKREDQRAAGRANNASYEALLDEAAELIRAGILPSEWQLRDGQKGGSLIIRDRWISCAGALRRAGISPGDNAAETLREELALAASLRHAREYRLDTRARRLPACDRRRAA